MTAPQSAGTAWSGSVSASGTATQSYGYSTNSNYSPSSGWISTGSASAETKGGTNSSYSGSSPLSVISVGIGSESGTASASGSDWTTFDYKQNTTLGSDNLWNLPTGSGGASGGASGGFSYSASGNYSVPDYPSYGSTSGSMSESGGETYSQTYNTNATLTSPTAGWTQTGSGSESASSSFNYGYSGSGSGNTAASGGGDSLTVSQSGSGSGSQTYGYGGSFDDSVDDGDWTGTTTQSGSSQVQDSFQLTDNSNSANSTSGSTTVTSTTNPSGPATITTASTGAGASAPVGVSETTNSYDQVDNPAIWESNGFLSVPGGVPAVPGLYNAGNSIYVGIYGTPTLPASVPGMVGGSANNQGVVGSLVSQSLAPAAVDAVWGMPFTPGTALKTAFAIGNTGSTASSEKLLGASAVFGTKNVAPFMPVTDAVFLADYGTHGVAAAPNAANFGSTFSGVIPGVCFAAGTLVLMADGSRKAIEEIEVGELVLASTDTDPEGVIAPRTVEAVFHNRPHALLDRKNVDVVIYATPEHGHYLPCIHACQAGKDMYGEQPLSHMIREGRKMIEAVRKYHRVFQTGEMQRSHPATRKAVELIRNGRLGKLQSIIGYNYPSAYECDFPAQPIPEWLDWDRWCGPNEVVPYHTDLYLSRIPYEREQPYYTYPAEKYAVGPGWMSFRPYSGGELPNWGCHGLSMVHWALDMDLSGPVEIWVDPPVKMEQVVYHVPEKRDRGDAACSRTIIHFKYANGVVLSLGSIDPKLGGGATFIGDKGQITIFREGYECNPVGLDQDPLPPDAIRVYQSDNHMQNFFNCVSSRKDPIMNIEAGHSVATLCHLGNIARRLGRRLKWDPEKEIFPGDDEANAYVDCPKRKGFELPEKV